MHVPVLVKEVQDILLSEKSELIVDATVGAGGHAEAILARAKVKLIGIDRDEDALRLAKRRLAPYKNRIHLAHLRFSQMESLLSELKVKQVSGFLFDLGVCSLHLENAKRGFSFQSDGPLDMRMDRSQQKNALDVVNGYSLSELASIFHKFGQERFSKKIASAILNRRKISPLRTTLQLRELVESAINPRYRIKSLARIFQAIRIEVNDELEELKEGLAQAIRFLAPGGRLAVISYHSLEHGLIRSKLKQESKGCICPPDLPVCSCGVKATLRMITAKPIVPSPGEIKINPRARSAKLWVAEKITPSELGKSDEKMRGTSGSINLTRRHLRKPM
jgi:16S rRNA (cytosine1402-N4)-methyltransferase